ncbi:hypothetical protein NG798_07695 [Ancylothrix sp. C2]|uniref:bestrophin family protein n=1 Tax=Ancylothrix sp. D3o TaxID=2953691 RepID=UPI0021BA406D|nr:bestrophin family ion channel [Ancylothrix sp. D3o]MCT7949666.1 hypothetical protein [Ancylothrix sp. D3o]
MIAEKQVWFKLALQVQGSVVVAIIPRVLFCTGFGVLISVLYALKLPVSWPSILIPVLSLVLGLLLVFRTNTAYDRFWEGRKCWGVLIINVRNLARQIWCFVDERKPEHREEKQAALRLLAAFAVAMKLHLRGEPINSEVEELISHSRYIKLQGMANPPLEIAFWIADFFKQQQQKNCLDSYQSMAMNQHLNSMVEALSGCERILRTPIPLAYAIHLKQLLLIYCLGLPFQMVKDLTWWTAPVVAVLSFALFGIEEIGIEIENPFGYDKNDLPLDGICATIRQNIEDLMTLSPTKLEATRRDLEVPLIPTLE